MTRMARRVRIWTAVIEDAGHDVHLDQPRRLHAAVRTFLAARNTPMTGSRSPQGLAY